MKKMTIVLLSLTALLAVCSLIVNITNGEGWGWYLGIGAVSGFAGWIYEIIEGHTI